MEKDKHGRRRNSVSIPLDLMIEILTRLPSKSLMKFKCLSKQHSSIIESRNFVDSYFSYFSNKPRLLFSVNEHELYSATTTTCSTVASHLMTIPRYILRIVAPPVRGLICYSIKPNQHVTCNPTTRQLLHLPQNQTWTGPYLDEYLLFGYEPISNRFKVISILTNYRQDQNLEDQFWIFTVGDGNSWRKIQDVAYPCCPVSLWPIGVCINGVLYYPCHNKSGNQIVVSTFDLNSENFRHISLPLGDWRRFPKLIDFQGKLALVECTKEIRVWVLEDAEKHEWSSKLYNLPSSLKYPRGLYEYSRAVGICEGEYMRGLITWHFNLDKKTIREFVIKMPPNHYHNLYHHVYANDVDNLVSL